MSFANIKYEISYTSPKDDVINDFLIPTLKESVRYDRAVGFFSSTALVNLSVGLIELFKNNGKMRLICSPKLSKEDIEAIQKGYENRDIVHSVMEDALRREFKNPTNYFEEERFNLIAHLIEDGYLDIKVAITLENTEVSMFHDKIGVFQDKNGNIVSFSGSLNESNNAFRFNHEHIDVFTSLESDYLRAIEKKNIFEKLWNNDDKTLEIIPFPKDLEEKIKSYKKEKIDYEIDKKQFSQKKEKKLTPFIPENIKIRPYQMDAQISWKENNFVGIYDMATGTGKTITALASIITLLEEKNYKMFIVICVPYQHLVDQWCEDLDEFNFKYIVGYSSPKYKNWKERLKDEVFKYNYGIRKTACFITTNSSYKLKFTQNLLSEIKGDICLVVDEAHNFGAKTLLKTLDDRFKYRLALSATLERKGDEIGTEALLNYFGKKCIEYSLEKAIDEEMLTRYEYYPIKVYLTEEELCEYIKISRELVKFLKVKKDGTVEYKAGAETLLIKRARIIAGAENKLDALRKAIKPFKNDNHILVYCGATTVKDDKFESATDSEIRQINKVSSILSDEFNMNVGKYTSEENASERQMLRKSFDEGNVIQALVAIRCLDEGVNIPSIRTAFILASSSNPKEYVQRRGRVLRKYDGKDYATIIDFVTLPRPLDNISPTEDLSYDYSLLKRELIRVKDFAQLSINTRDSDKLIDEIEEVYGIIDLNEKKGTTYE